MIRSCSCLVLVLLVGLVALRADEIDKKYPLDPLLKVLAEDVKNETYRKLVLEKMLSTDLAAEWQRVETADNPESFVQKHGGKDKVLADPDLKAAYERRVKIREDFLNLMRDGYKRHKQTAPFDKGQKAETAGTITKKPTAKAVALEVVMPCPDAEKHWPRFRGPSGQGLTGVKELPVKWNAEGDGIVWRVKVPGKGNSSPVIWGDRLFLTGWDDKGAQRHVHCVSTKSGEVLWSTPAPQTKAESGVRDKNGYASSSPVVDGERVIVFLGSVGLLCLDFNGKIVWHYKDLNVRTTHGTGSSPVLYKDLVILAQDQNQSDSIFLALEKKTGKKVWEGKRARAMTWCTPVVVKVGDRDELIMVGGETAKGYDPLTGKELWSLDGPTQEVVPAVVVGKDTIYSASGRNGPTIAFRPGGSGDVTETHTIWSAVRNGPHVPTPILVGGRLYTANDFGILTCLDAETGELVYTQRLNDKFSASPIVAGETIYFPAESGVTFVIKAGPKLEVVAKNDLGSPILASPAVADGKLFLRTETELVCIGKR